MAQAGVSNKCKSVRNERTARRGYVLIALMLSITFLLGVGGLAFDVGRMYVTKSEAQSFVDSAAMSAATELDGTSAGIARAQNAIAGNPKKWGFGANSFT